MENFDFFEPDYHESDSIFVKVLRKTMFTKKLNQQSLADLLGTRQSQVSNWLAGKSLPNYYSLQIMKTKLGISVETLFE
jgi:transcriptional regulator with XRE-family HTH domain